MKRLLYLTLLAACGFARADDLGEAERLLQAKSYGKALPVYQRLADAGNPAAQMRLGEMYWFGDGVKSDLAKARQWFERSAAGGNVDAAASLASLKRRETRGAEITYWTRTYQGEDMVSGKFACQPPELPAVSRTKAEIQAVEQELKAWHDCYNGFVAHLNASLPPGKRIPGDVLDMMTPTEGLQAQKHLDGVYARLGKKAQQDAAAFNAREAAWTRATETYVQNHTEQRASYSPTFPKERGRSTAAYVARLNLVTPSLTR